MSTRSLLVTGATGKQGGALISALLAHNNSFDIYALTRNKASASAQRLASKSKSINLVQGSFTEPTAIFQGIKPWGLFLMSTPENAAKEEKEGKEMVSAAIKAGVKYIVFTATDRGAKSETDPTPIPHFASKFNIEKYIEAEAKKAGDVTWTFLRPVAFMDNMTNDFLGKAFIAAWKLNGEDSKLQLIATSDIGKIAADAFLNAESAKYHNKSISLTADDLTPAEAAKDFKDVTGKDIPTTYPFVAVVLKWLLRTHLGIMFDWFKTDGFGAHLPALKKRYPFLKDFKTWLAEESAWKKQ